MGVYGWDVGVGVVGVEDFGGVFFWTVIVTIVATVTTYVFTVVAAVIVTLVAAVVITVIAAVTTYVSTARVIIELAVVIRTIVVIRPIFLPTTVGVVVVALEITCLLYTSPSPRD